jgi:hypothetical protein
MRLSDLWGGRPDDEDKKKEAETIAQAIVKGMRQDAENFRETVEKLMKDGARKDEATERALRGLVQTLHEVADRVAPKAADGETVLTSQQIEDAVSTMSANVEEQNEILLKAMKNDEFRAKFMDAILEDMEKKLTKSLDGITLSSMKIHMENKEREDKRAKDDERRVQESRAKNRGRKEEGAGSAIDRLIDFLTLNALGGGGRGGLGAVIEKLGLTIGTLGLITMLPEKVEQTLGDITASFAAIRKLTAGFLGPIFRMLDNLPVVGAIVRKIPYLNAILFFFDNVTDIAKKFSKEGVREGLKLTLDRLYDFFVGDVIELVGSGLDKLENLLGVDWVDWEARGKELRKKGDDWVTRLGKVLFDPLTPEQQAKGDANRKMVKDAFKWVQGWYEYLDGLDKDLHAKWFTFWGDAWAATKKWFEDSTASVRTSVGEWAEAGKKLLTDPEVLAQMGEYLLGKVSSIGTSVGTFFVDSWNSAMELLPDFGGLSVESISKKWDDAVAALPSLVDEVSALFAGFWESIKKWAKDAFDSVTLGWFSSDAPAQPSGQAPIARAPNRAEVISGASDLRKAREGALRDAQAKSDRGQRGLSRGGTANDNRVSNRTSVSQTSYSISGSVKAGRNDPLNSGGSGW